MFPVTVKYYFLYTFSNVKTVEFFQFMDVAIHFYRTCSSNVDDTQFSTAQEVV